MPEKAKPTLIGPLVPLLGKAVTKAGPYFELKFAPKLHDLINVGFYVNMVAVFIGLGIGVLNKRWAMVAAIILNIVIAIVPPVLLIFPAIRSDAAARLMLDGAVDMVPAIGLLVLGYLGLLLTVIFSWFILSRKQ